MPENDAFTRGFHGIPDRKKLRSILASLLLAASPAFAADYATCILDKMPKAQNDVAANSIMQVCAQAHGNILTVKQGSGRGWFGYKSGAECAAKEAAGTPSNRAAFLIRQACGKLYDEEQWWQKNATPLN